MPTKEERHDQWAKADKDKVILHMFQRSKTRPNGSPFVIKLETFLRMTDIKYEAEFEEPMSSKGKSPWMTFNGESFADSQFCMEHLSDKLEKDLSKHLSKKNKAVARSMRIMLEDHLYWCLASLSFIHQKGKYAKTIMPPLPVPGFMQGFVFNMFMKNFGKQAQAQGIGRHSQEEVEKLAIADLKSVSEYLGDKAYVMGAEPTELDASLFGFLCMILAGDPDDDNVVKKAVEEDMVNLKSLFERMKGRYWADWDENLYVDHKKEEEEKREREEKEKKEKEDKEEKEKKEKEKKEKEERKKKEKEEKEKKDKEEKEKKEKERKEKEKKEKEEKEKKEKEKKERKEKEEKEKKEKEEKEKKEKEEKEKKENEDKENKDKENKEKDDKEKKDKE